MAEIVILTAPFIPFQDFGYSVAVGYLQGLGGDSVVLWVVSLPLRELTLALQIQMLPGV